MSVLMEPAPKPSLPVEPLFDRIVEMSGGKRVDSVLAEPPDWDNADYVFHDTGVIAELKEIQKDQNADRELSQRIGEIYQKHAARLGPIVGRVKVRIDLLPEDIRNEMIVQFQRRIERPIKKPAKQIKETKARLGMPDARGLLILVNDASTFLTPQRAGFFLRRILSKYHSSIDHIIYSSVNMLVQTDELPHGACFWWDSGVPGRREVPTSLAEALRDNWMRAIDDQVGVPGYRIEIAAGGPEADQMAFVEPPHGKDSTFFVRPKRFYEDPETGFKYYCEEVSEGAARLYLIESHQHGELFQAEFDQKLIYATETTYQEIDDQVEIARLKKMVKRFRRPRQSNEREASVVGPTPPEPQKRVWLRCILIGAAIGTLCGMIASTLTAQGLSMPLVAWAAIGSAAALLGCHLGGRR